jgi:hypothetical protein
MANVHDLRSEIAEALARQSANVLPNACARLGLDPGDTDEAWKSKRGYVLKRLAAQPEEFLVELAHKVLRDSESESLRQALETFALGGGLRITLITRQNLLDELLMIGPIEGRINFISFLKRIWPLDHMPSTDSRFDTAAGDIGQHMVNNDDWDYDYLFGDYLQLKPGPDERFLKFLEQAVHPSVRVGDTQQKYVAVINKHLASDGFHLEPFTDISGYPVYRAVAINAGVRGSVKNLIFAANGPKPEIVLGDAINNDIQIVKNAEYCLVYDLPISQSGLLWSDLVAWWAAKHGTNTPAVEMERRLYRRLEMSLGSPPEKLLFDAYYRNYVLNWVNNFRLLFRKSTCITTLIH